MKKNLFDGETHLFTPDVDFDTVCLVPGRPQDADPEDDDTPLDPYESPFLVYEPTEHPAQYGKNASDAYVAQMAKESAWAGLSLAVGSLATVLGVQADRHQVNVYDKEGHHIVRSLFSIHAKGEDLRAVI